MAVWLLSGVWDTDGDLAHISGTVSFFALKKKLSIFELVTPLNAAYEKLKIHVKSAAYSSPRQLLSLLVAKYRLQIQSHSSCGILIMIMSRTFTMYISVCSITS